jgi:hypothetical protein
MRGFKDLPKGLIEAVAQVLESTPENPSPENTINQNTSPENSALPYRLNQRWWLMNNEETVPECSVARDKVVKDMEDDKVQQDANISDGREESEERAKELAKKDEVPSANEEVEELQATSDQRTSDVNQKMCCIPGLEEAGTDDIEKSKEIDRSTDNIISVKEAGIDQEVEKDIYSSNVEESDQEKASKEWSSLLFSKQQKKESLDFGVAKELTVGEKRIKENIDSVGGDLREIGRRTGAEPVKMIDVILDPIGGYRLLCSHASGNVQIVPPVVSDPAPTLQDLYDVGVDYLGLSDEDGVLVGSQDAEVLLARAITAAEALPSVIVKASQE